MNYNPILWEALSSFDGKRVDSLRFLISKSDWTKAEVEYLLYLIENEDENYQIGASWLLLNTNLPPSSFDGECINRLTDLLNDTFIHWQVSLHLLQMFERLPLSEAQLSELFPTIRELMGHKKTLIRAWAFNAAVLIADKDPRFRTEVQLAIRRAGTNESASVKARIRNRASKHDWLN